jgi:hypothetical protein
MYGGIIYKSFSMKLYAFLKGCIARLLIGAKGFVLGKFQYASDLNRPRFKISGYSLLLDLLLENLTML